MSFDWYQESCPHGVSAGHCREHPRAVVHQRPPEGDWKIWVLHGDRGTGKTRAATGYVVNGIMNRKVRRTLLIGPTWIHVYQNMIGGNSGLLLSSTLEFFAQFDYHSTVRWPNGALCLIRDSREPDSLRGLEVDLIWAENPEKWFYSEENWRNIGFLMGTSTTRLIVTGGMELPGHIRGIFRGRGDDSLESKIRFTEAHPRT